ncbi:MAG: hypothetical protein E6R11_03615 [Rhodocyclaceae bacterium]|jgi:hypothetical protein|nr:MAG: hypothetical protein E6R11_03615 [Rhodocyclaceae bacterium]
MEIVIALATFMTITGVLPVFVYLLVTRLKQRASNGTLGNVRRGCTEAEHSDSGVANPNSKAMVQNARARRRSALATIGLWLGLIGIVVVWVSPHSAGDVSSLMGRSLAEYPRESVSLSEFTRFEWTEVLVFPDYTRRKEICDQLRIGGGDCWWFAPGRVTEGEQFLVFVDGTVPVHAEFHPYRNGEIEPKLFPVARFKKGTKFQVKPGTGANPPTLRRADE